MKNLSDSKKDINPLKTKDISNEHNWSTTSGVEDKNTCCTWTDFGVIAALLSLEKWKTESLNQIAPVWD